MCYIREVPYIPIKGDSEKLEAFKHYITNKKVIDCNKVAILKKERKLMVGSYYKHIIDWLISNPDRFEIVSDFVGYDFGIDIEERLGRAYFRNPLIYDEEIYEGYSKHQFQKWDVATKLEYIANTSNYVPVVIQKENFYADNLSHMWSHIKNDKETMKDLEKYLQTSRFVPRFHVYYFIRYDASKDMVYLKRDYDESPKEDVSTNNTRTKTVVDVELPEQIRGVFVPRKKKAEAYTIEINNKTEETENISESQSYPVEEVVEETQEVVIENGEDNAEGL